MATDRVVGVRARRNRGWVIAGAITIVVAALGALIAVFVPPARHAVALFIVRPGVEQGVVILGTLATIAAVIVALSTSARAERRQDTRDQIEAAARLERRAQRQAVLVQVRVAMPIEGNPERIRYVDVQNLSPLPVSRVTAVLIAQQRLPDEGKVIESPARENVTIDGYREHRFEVDYDVDWDVAALSAESIFNDAFGDVWRADSTGRLTLLIERKIERHPQLNDPAV